MLLSFFLFRYTSWFFFITFSIQKLKYTFQRYTDLVYYFLWLRNFKTSCSNLHGNCKNFLIKFNVEAIVGAVHSLLTFSCVRHFWGACPVWGGPPPAVRCPPPPAYSASSFFLWLPSWLLPRHPTLPKKIRVDNINTWVPLALFWTSHKQFYIHNIKG